MSGGNLSRFLQSPAVLAVIKVCPQMASFGLLRLLIFLYFLANREEIELVRRNIEEVFKPRHTVREINLLVRSTLKGISYHYFEKLFLACSSDRRWKGYFLRTIRIVRRRVLDRSLAQNRGVILVTAHFGAVEFLPGYLALLGYPVAIVAKFKTPRLREKCKAKARRIGVTIIDANEKNSLISAISALKAGRILITQCDEVACWKPDPERTIGLFGTSFQIDRTISVLQKRAQAPMVFGYVRRDNRGGYITEIEDLDGACEARTDNHQEEPVLRKLEKLVYAYPEQWYIWKSFQRMKAVPIEEFACENRENRDFLTPSTPLPIFRLSRSFSEQYGECCRQASV